MVLVDRRRNDVWKRHTRRFLSRNKSVIALIVWIILGVVLGSCIFPTLSEDHRRFLVSVYRTFDTPTDFISGCACVLSTALYTIVMLAMLFLCGITAFGWPIIVLLLLLFGFQAGITNCSIYCDSGLLTLAVTEVIPLILNGICMIIAGGAALRMSSAFAMQLLPSAAHCGSIWHDFKRYLSAFLVSVFVTMVSAVLKTIIMMYW